VEGTEGTEIAFCGCRFDGGYDLGDPVRNRFEGGWVGIVAVMLTEGFIGSENFVIIPPSAWREGVVKKECSFWRK
jgi:hypothetical protein